MPEEKLIIVYGQFGYNQAWIREDINQEYNFINPLFDYPCFEVEAGGNGYIDIDVIKDEFINECLKLIKK